jgi:LysR family glycine cleavage system transcriptional activator
MNLLHLAIMLNQTPLSLLRAFEAAGRTGSFRTAADEIALSPSAVSHAIRKLERTLGARLFEREGRLVRLSPEGEALMRHVGRAFEELRRGLEVVSTRAPHLLRLHCAPSFAAQWLTPRLARFLRDHPGIEIRLAAGTDYTRFGNEAGPSHLRGLRFEVNGAGGVGIAGAEGRCHGGVCGGFCGA